ncbi:MAG: hypothetical protein Satyrvirus21_13 [Satyrvirus sp.]|uniref:Uncharacterized protein n=1 Tax=Satyrvirus sp. TaxID=2487771 RepID=A0A3G5AJB2_9VIRU|nr:MAG: hypothetical protein Satyrvirus21_13 [Satyrvirus sp.]
MNCKGLFPIGSNKGKLKNCNNLIIPGEKYCPRCIVNDINKENVSDIFRKAIEKFVLHHGFGKPEFVFESAKYDIAMEYIANGTFKLCPTKYYLDILTAKNLGIELSPEQKNLLKISNNLDEIKKNISDLWENFVDALLYSIVMAKIFKYAVETDLENSLNIILAEKDLSNIFSGVSDKNLVNMHTNIIDCSSSSSDYDKYLVFRLHNFKFNIYTIYPGKNQICNLFEFGTGHVGDLKLFFEKMMVIQNNLEKIFIHNRTMC